MNDEYWDEYGEFNEKIDELRDSLMSDMKQDIRSKIERLEKENKRLLDDRRNLDTLEAEAAKAKREAQIARDNAVRDAVKMRYEDILKTLSEPRYFAKYRSEKRSKCEKCNDNREVLFTSADGQSKEMPCECNTYISIYSIAETWVYSVYRRDSKESFYYDVTRDDEMRETSATMYDGRDFGEVPSYPKVLFDAKDKCQEYVDYLHKKQDISIEVPNV